MPGLLDLLSQTWPARMAQDVWGQVTAPRDAYQGNLDPLSPEGIARMNGLAGLMVGTPFGRGGLGSGARLPGAIRGEAEQEILSPNQLSTSARPLPQAQLGELENQQRTLMQLGPLVPALIKLGVTQEQMLSMNPTQAFQFIKARSPQGMGTVDRTEQQSVMDAINQIREQRGTITDALLVGKK